MAPRRSAVEAAVGRMAAGASLLGGLATLLITAFVTFDVLMRYFLGEPQLFVDELAGFLQVVVIFWGLAYTFQAGGHVRVDLVTARLPPPARAWLRVVTLVVGITILGITTWVTWQTMVSAWRYERVSTVMLYPIWIPMLMIPTGLALMGLVMLALLVRQVRVALGPPPTRDEVAPPDSTR